MTLGVRVNKTIGLGSGLTLLDFWANRTPLFGRLDLRNPNSLDLADTIAPFSQYLKMWRIEHLKKNVPLY